MAVLRRMLVAVACGAAITVSAVAFSSVKAHAYGTDHLYQVTFSENCVNPTLCAASESNPFGIGGIWGWVEPDAGGSADAQVQFQGHANSNPLLNGSMHLPSSWAWAIIHLSTPPSPFVSPTDPNGNYFFFTVPSFPGFNFLTPATPGHYGGSLAPGISANVTVVKLH